MTTFNILVMGLPKSVNEIWEGILSYIRGDASMRGIADWIHALSPSHIENNVVYLEAPNEQVVHWVTENFMHIFEEALEKLGYDNVGIKFIVRPSRRRKEEGTLFHRSQYHSTLLKKYTFDNFVVGQENQVIHTIALRIVEEGISRFNPFTVYGASGRGKTHFLHAIGNAILDKHPRRLVKYVHAETFLNEMMESIRSGKMHKFKNAYRNLDVLIFDGLEFLEGKSALQQEFLNTITYLLDRNAQVIIASIKPIRSLLIREEIKSRLSSGIVMELAPPSLETRYGILKLKAQREGVDIPDDILWEIARMDIQDVRVLEGILSRISAYMLYSEVDELGYRTFLRMIRDLMPKKKDFDINYLIDAALSVSGVSEEVLLSGDRRREILRLRYAIIYIARHRGNMSYSAIGKVLRRNHSSIINAWNKARRLMSKDRDFRNLVERIEMEMDSIY